MIKISKKLSLTIISLIFMACTLFNPLGRLDYAYGADYDLYEIHDNFISEFGYEFVENGLLKHSG